MVPTNLLRFLSTLAALAVSTATVVAPDLIDRRIAKEPVYHSGSPKYLPPKIPTSLRSSNGLPRYAMNRTPANKSNWCALSNR